ncbi:hypothetical protein PtA15_2A23 [Puccinia triticina]|uniref:Uncharacterized protein n=1 Tax=Puccinia triticina TaxID=208348 RepID=A0ABY7CB68_9BASI|nr:uncharacterized protein PtA15_2A23 [Puccinia triticina]WAQ81712.1 hypothetical protein PtA15_2A23 [Puccinia triticina]WAR52600.1 hypothetical protein PtB15_2B24 [Puccinia triticina]
MTTSHPTSSERSLLPCLTLLMLAAVTVQGMYVGPASTTRAASAGSDINHAAGALKAQEEGLLTGNLRKTDTPLVLPGPNPISQKEGILRPEENILQGPPSKPAGKIPKKETPGRLTQALGTLKEHS